MDSPWRSLEAIPRLVAFPCTWRLHLGQDYEEFKMLCLQESALRPISYPCPLPTSCAYRILNRPDGSICGNCLHHPIMCEQIELTPADVTPLELNWHKL